MIFFVHHDARPASQVNRSAAAHRTLSVQAGELATDEMSLVQQQPVLWGQLVNAHQHALVESSHPRHRLTNLRQHAQSLSVSRSTRECIPLEIARETHASGDDDVGALS